MVLIWIILAAGPILYRANTFKFIPAALLFTLGFVFFLFSKTPCNHDRQTKTLFLLFTIHLILVLIPSIFWYRGYDLYYLMGVQIVCYGTVFLILNLQLSGKEIKKLLIILTGLLGIISVTGIMEFFGFVLLRLNGKQRAISVFFNNPNLYSAVLLVLLPATYTLIFWVKQRKLQIAIAIISIMGLLNLFMARSRACIIGHGISILLMALLLPSIMKWEKRKTQRLYLILCSGFSAILFLFLFTNTEFRLKIINTFTTKNIRWNIWQDSAKAWLQEPMTILFGNGLGSFRALYPSFKEPGYRLIHSFTGGDAIHNEYIELLMDGGVFSLGAYLVFIFYSVKRLIKKIHSGNTNINNKLSALFSLTVISALLADGFFSTALRTNYIQILFYMSLALGIFTTNIDAEEISAPKLKSGINAFFSWNKILGIGILIALLLSTPQFLRRFKAERLLYKGSTETEDLKKELFLRQAVAADPCYIEPAYQLAHHLLESAQPDEALDQLNAVEQIVPRYGNSGYFRALALIQQEEYSVTTVILENYLKIERAHWNAETALLYAYAINNQWDKTVEQWSLIQELHSLQKDSTQQKIVIDSRMKGFSAIPGKTRAEDIITAGPEDAKQLIQTALGSPAVPLSIFSFRLEYLSGEICRKGGLDERAMVHYSRAVSLIEPSTLLGHDLEAHRQSSLWWGRYILELYEKTEDDTEKLRHAKILFAITKESSYREAVMELYKKQGNFRFARLSKKTMN